LTEIIQTITTKHDVANLRKEISESAAGVIKWIFILGISQIAATLAIAILFLNK
jgi:hypothetical protein